MALYVITDGPGDNESVVLDGIDAVKDKFIYWLDEGVCDTEIGLPDVYQLGKKMKVEIETKITVKGE